MSGLYFLTSDDFGIVKGGKGPLLGNNLKGISLVFFYSPSCQYCQRFLPVFKTLPNKIGGCQFGMINVSQNKRVTMMSAETVAPIEYVPYIILYVNGKPYIRYDGPHDENEIKRFIVEVANQLQNRERFMREENKTRVQEKVQAHSKNSSYAFGKPLYGDDDDYYLEFDQAYILLKK